MVWDGPGERTRAQPHRAAEAVQPRAPTAHRRSTCRRRRRTGSRARLLRLMAGPQLVGKPRDSPLDDTGAQLLFGPWPSPTNDRLGVGSQSAVRVLGPVSVLRTAGSLVDRLLHHYPVVTTSGGEPPQSGRLDDEEGLQTSRSRRNRWGS